MKLSNTRIVLAAASYTLIASVYPVTASDALHQTDHGQVTSLTPSPWADILGQELVLRTGEIVETKSLAAPLLALYFSASWCPPCRKFTPELIEFYEKNRDRVDVVLMGMDQTEAGREKYFSKSQMPWLSVPFNSVTPPMLFEKLGQSGIPALVIINSNGEIVTDNATADITRNPDKAVDEWTK
jgi:nucleoredoxin